MTPKELRNLTKTLKVLYVEDDTFLREATKKMFAQFFESIDEAVDGKEGWEAYQANNYDLVITDINMPNLNGVEMLRLIKQRDPNQAVIVTSAYNDADSLLSLIDIGIDKFLLKPVDFAKIIDCFIHTALYIQNKRTNFSEAKRIIELEAEVAALKSQLNAANIPTASKTKKPQTGYLLSSEDYALLKALEVKFSKSIYDIQMLGDYPDHLKEHLLSALEKYAEILYKDYQEISTQINKLDQSIAQDEEKFQGNINKICNLLEDVSENLRRARKSSFNKATGNQLIKSMQRVIATLRA